MESEHQVRLSGGDAGTRQFRGAMVEDRWGSKHDEVRRLLLRGEEVAVQDLDLHAVARQCAPERGGELRRASHADHGGLRGRGRFGILEDEARQAQLLEPPGQLVVADPRLELGRDLAHGPCAVERRQQALGQGQQVGATDPLHLVPILDEAVLVVHGVQTDAGSKSQRGLGMEGVHDVLSVVEAAGAPTGGRGCLGGAEGESAAAPIKVR